MTNSHLDAVSFDVLQRLLKTPELLVSITLIFTIRRCKMRKDAFHFDSRQRGRLRRKNASLFRLDADAPHAGIDF